MNPNLPIQSIMTSELVTVKAGEPLTVIRQVFEKNRFHHIPVIGESGNLLGIISREDFYKVAYVMSIDGQPDRFGQLTVEDIMTKYPLHLDPDDSIGLAADIFLANKFHALPIVEDGKLTGLVTSHDLLAYSFTSPVGEADVEMANYDED
jgi:CBS domain-containing protein